MTKGRVRRIRADEGEKVRALRLEATADPDAAIAFLTTSAEEEARDAAFWSDRAATGADGDSVAQFVLLSGEEWVGTATVLRRRPGSIDHLGRLVGADRADVVGVYVRPTHRGTGGIDALLDAAAAWAAGHGDPALTLDVHEDNTRAQRAYARAGFRPTGIRFTSQIGPELEMSRPLRPSPLG